MNFDTRQQQFLYPPHATEGQLADGTEQGVMRLGTESDVVNWSGIDRLR